MSNPHVDKTRLRCFKKRCFANDDYTQLAVQSESHCRLYNAAVCLDRVFEVFNQLEHKRRHVQCYRF
jgi:hypothetical protein